MRTFLRSSDVECSQYRVLAFLYDWNNVPYVQLCLILPLNRHDQYLYKIGARRSRLNYTQMQTLLATLTSPLGSTPAKGQNNTWFIYSHCPLSRQWKTSRRCPCIVISPYLPVRGRSWIVHASTKHTFHRGISWDMQTGSGLLTKEEDKRTSKRKFLLSFGVYRRNDSNNQNH